MEEKKTTKISLSTFFLILAIIAICVMGYFIYKLNDDKTKATNEMANLENKINTLENTITSNKKEQTNVENNTSKTNSQKNIKELSDISNIIKNSQKHEYFRITELKKDGNNYIAKVNYYVPTAMSEKEYSEIVKNKKVTLNGKEYIFDNSKNSNNLQGYGYAYIEGEPVDGGFWVEKNDDGYIFISEIGGVYTIINHIKDSYTIKLDGNLKMYYVASDEVETIAEFVNSKKDINEVRANIIYFDNEYSISCDAR
ncbi:MAG: hypothetical protein J5881_01425 [Clostridia bacterium]|nr:hypothetical protein [Clostridia bacterium]